MLPLLILAAAVLGGVSLLATAPEVEQVDPSETLRAVRVIEARPGSMQLVVRSQGTVVPRTESQLVPEVSGRVVWTSPSLVSGGFFHRGDVLLRLERRDYETALARARASLARAEGEWEHARANLERREKLAREGVASSAQLDDARRAFRVAEAARDEARLVRRQARDDLARTELRAPFDGRVRKEHTDVGHFVSRGQALATLYATDYAEIRLPIPDAELAYLQLPLFTQADADKGPAVTLRAHFAGAEHVWHGRIVRTEGEIDPKSRMVHAVARVEDPYGKASGTAPLAIGLFVEAEIAGPVAEGVLRVPRGALHERNQLLLLDDENRLQPLEAELLRLERDHALVRAKLPAGARICISQIARFVPGMRVEPRLVEARGSEDAGTPAPDEAARGRAGAPGAPRT